MSKRISLLMAILTLVVSTLACTLPTAGGKNAEASLTSTSDAVLINAGTTTVPDAARTQAASDTPIPPTATTKPSDTPVPPTATPVWTATNTPIPCNWAQFVTDVTYADGTQVQAGSSFTKTWRLKNIGSCTWTSAYQMIFASGDAMNAASAVQLTTGTVAPGGVVDVSVTLTAPATAGTYKGNFKLRAPDGTVFGIGADKAGVFWVQIVTVVPTPTFTNPPPMADLRITQLVINPNPANADQVVQVTVSVVNEGNAVASQFVVQWYGLQTFANPSCEWTVMENINPGAGMHLSCNTFKFASPYAPNQTSKAVVDTTNHVVESNEGNNIFTTSITVNP